MLRTMRAGSPRFARLLGVFTAVCGSLLLVTASPAPQKKTLKLAVPSVNEGLLPIEIAIDQGLFKAEGVSVRADRLPRRRPGRSGIRGRGG